MGKFEENQRKMFEIEPNTYLGAHEDTNITKSAEQWLQKKRETHSTNRVPEAANIIQKIAFSLFFRWLQFLRQHIHRLLPILLIMQNRSPRRFPVSLASTGIYIYIYIENADATPPHLDVFVRLGSSGDLLGVLKVICHESLSLFSFTIASRSHSKINRKSFKNHKQS